VVLQGDLRCHLRSAAGAYGDLHHIGSAALGIRSCVSWHRFAAVLAKLRQRRHAVRAAFLCMERPPIQFQRRVPGLGAVLARGIQESCDISRMGCNGLRTTSRGHRGRDRCPLPGWLDLRRGLPMEQPQFHVQHWPRLVVCLQRASNVFRRLDLDLRVGDTCHSGSCLFGGQLHYIWVDSKIGCLLFANVFHVCLRQRLLDLDPQQLRLLDGRVGRLHHLVHTGSEAHRQPVVARIAVAVELVGIRCSRRVGSS